LRPTLRASWAATDLRRREIEAQTLKKVNDDHRAIVSAVEVGDADAAARENVGHVDVARRTAGLVSDDAAERDYGVPIRDYMADEPARDDCGSLREERRNG
jgi:DNA-binding GntR family transcriptional regulator